MKRLMLTMAAAVLGVTAWATPNAQSINFESTTLGPIDFSKDDSGGSANNRYWLTKDNSATANAISFADAGKAAVPSDMRTVEFPDSTDHLKGMELDCAGSYVYRTINPVNDGENPQAIGEGYYVDTLIQFTASSEATQVLPDTNAKIGVWLYGADEAPFTTNLMVTAGYYDAENSVSAKTYAVNNVTVSDGTWYRLTVKAIQITSGTDPMVGFVVYIDGQAVSYTGDAFASVPELTAVAQKYYKEGVRQLFPSLVAADSTGAQSLTGVGFSGQGLVDEISLSEKAPGFAADDAMFALSWTEGVTSVTYNDGNGKSGTFSTTDLAYTTTNLVISGVAKSLAVSGVYDSANGYFETFLKAGNSTTTVTDTGFAWESGSPAGTIAAKLENFRIGDNKYATLNDALAGLSSAGGTITLARSYEVKAAVEDPEEAFDGFDIDVNTTIDLNGKALTVETTYEDDLFTINEDGVLTIINTGDAATARIAAATLAYVDGELVLGSADGNTFAVDAVLTSGGEDPSLVKVKVVAEGNTEQGGDFTYASGVASGSSCSRVGDYWEVVVAPPAPTTTYTVTVPTLPENVASVSVTTNGDVVVASAAGDVTVDAGCNVKVTFTAADEYEFVSGGEQTKDGIAANWTVETPVVQIKKYAINWTDSENVVVSNGEVQVEGTTGNFPKDTVLKFYATVGSITNVTVGGVAQEVANPFEYTVGSAGATIKVLAGETPAPVEPIKPGDEPTYDDPAKAQAAADTINANKAEYIAKPYAEMDASDKAAYDSKVKAVADGNTVKLDFADATVEAAFQSEVDQAVKNADIAGTGATATIAAEKGFYYSIVAGSEVTGITNEGNRVLATDTTVQLTKPVVEGTKAFFKVQVSVNPKPAN